MFPWRKAIGKGNSLREELDHVDVWSGSAFDDLSSSRVSHGFIKRCRARLD
jgi:hypothetical protein